MLTILKLNTLELPRHYFPFPNLFRVNFEIQKIEIDHFFVDAPGDNVPTVCQGLGRDNPTQALQTSKNRALCGDGVLSWTAVSR